MKKVVCLITLVALVLAGCSAAPVATPTASAATQAPATVAPTATETPTDAPTDTPAAGTSAPAATTGNPSATVAVDKSGLTVKVTIPATLVSGNADDVIKNAKAQGASDVVKNADGSLTYTMSKDVYQTMLDVMKSSIQKSIDGMKTQGTYPSVKDITSNADFTEITVTVDQEKFKGSMDMFALLSLYIGAAYYEAFDGQATPRVTFHLVDAATKAEFQKLVYPDDMKTGS